jgi:predicted Rossmann-fold nucleotide-binding protein
MAAMNDGVALADGHVIGVIHKMWLPSTTNGDPKEAGAHSVFESLENAGSSTAAPSTTKSSVTTNETTKFIRQLIVASGDDLQERKRLLVEKSDALVVLPGGPGTWDELWEMACAKGIGMSTIPIVCVNCDDYYGPFQDMLLRAYNEGLMKHVPEDLVYFVETPEEAVRWVEAMNSKGAKAKWANGTATSFFHDPFTRRSRQGQVATDVFRENAFFFVCGVIGGVLLTTSIFALRHPKH